MQIRLTRSPILECRNHRSGQRLTQYSIDGCADKAEKLSSTGLQELLEWTKVESIPNG